MKKVAMFLLMYSAIVGTTTAQTAAKAAYVEIGGPGLASLNFDMRLANAQNGLGFRVGVGAFSLNGISAVTVPLGLNYLFGKSKNYFEVGAGYTYLKVGASSKSTTKNFNESFGNLTIGYRYAPEKDGFFFKAGLTPVFNSNFFLPYFPEIGLGYKF